MTHYLLRLCTPNKEWGKPAVVLQEVHKDLPRAEYGWARQMEDKALYFTCRKCALADDEEDAKAFGQPVCKRYQAWLEHKGAHEDAVEAEKLRGEDVA